jgi:hypothetical protein
MNEASRSLRGSRVPARVMRALFLGAALSILPSSGLLAAESSPSPAMTMSPAEAACDSAEQLGLIIGFLQDTDVAADGWLPVLVGVIAGLSEARQLAGSVADTYRPLVDDLIGSLEGLRATVDELREMDTTGAAIAAVGESITDIGNAMDALTVQLRDPCPSASPAPSDGAA